ncbi:alpha-1,4-N-acetylglucosaminyltransferase-like [Spea bombifrons]|uniref:alpha-1,4-N-acetylglucosaminyltransferase-like n=1 Tax=Spea bombifrons TaxID=233779 RepID=UPI00234919C4|nr:alpha-1,4-N-acetylglucosaminyltransferase-like [Spea bombifrons]
MNNHIIEMTSTTPFYSQSPSTISVNQENIVTQEVLVSTYKTSNDMEKNTSNYLNPGDILSQGNGIIFLESGSRAQPPPLVLCAIESAARVYSDRPIVFFINGLPEINTNDDENRTRKRFPTISYLQNVYIFPLKMKEVFKDTPLFPWYQKIDPTRQKHWMHVSSDGCRLALIWKYGGIYMDTDIISVRPIPEKTFLAALYSQDSSNGVFGLPPRHNFTWTAMEDFVKNYNGAIWGQQGPQLFTRTLRKYCVIPNFTAVEDIICGNISFLNPQRFYPIPYPSWRLYYKVWEKIPTFNDSYALHLWNYMNKDVMTMVPGSNTLVDNLYKQHCPITYGALLSNESIYL